MPICWLAPVRECGANDVYAVSDSLESGRKLAAIKGNSLPIYERYPDSLSHLAGSFPDEINETNHFGGL